MSEKTATPIRHRDDCKCRSCTARTSAWWPTEAEQREIARSLLAGFDDDTDFGLGVRTAINALLYREAPDGWN